MSKKESNPKPPDVNNKPVYERQRGFALRSNPPVSPRPISPIVSNKPSISVTNPLLLPENDCIRIRGRDEGWYMEFSKDSLANAINVLIQEGRIKL